MKTTHRARRILHNPPGFERPVTLEISPNGITMRPYRCRGDAMARMSLDDLCVILSRYKTGELWAPEEFNRPAAAHAETNVAGSETTEGEQP